VVSDGWLWNFICALSLMCKIGVRLLILWVNHGLLGFFLWLRCLSSIFLILEVNVVRSSSSLIELITSCLNLN